MLAWLWQTAVSALCIFSLVQLFLSFAVLIRLLPVLMRFLRLVLRGFLILSFRLYFMLLTWLAPYTHRLCGINLLGNTTRVAMTTILSVLFGICLLGITGISLTIWGSVLFLLHGLAVGLMWDDIEKPGGLQLGVRIE